MCIYIRILYIPTCIHTYTNVSSGANFARSEKPPWFSSWERAGRARLRRRIDSACVRAYVRTRVCVVRINSLCVSPIAGETSGYW